MITLFSWFKRGEQIRRLEEEKRKLSEIAKQAADLASLQQAQIESLTAELAQARRESTDIYRRTINTLMLANGSRGVMFEDVGPQPTPLKEVDLSKYAEQQPMPARMAARRGRLDFIGKFMSEQAAETPTPLTSTSSEEAAS